MFKIFVSIVLCLLMVSPCLSETSVWIAKTDSSEMYIGGTIHILREKDKPYPPAFEKAYEASDLIVLETDISKLKSPEVQQEFLSHAMFLDGTTLDKILTDEVFKKLEGYCKSKGMNINALNQFKPWSVTLTLLVLELQKLGVDQEGIDLFYYEKALNNKKSIEILETVEKQIEMITSMGEGNESSYVSYCIDELDKTEEFFNGLVNAWKIGDEESMSNLLLKDISSKFPLLYKSIITERNMNWLPLIENHLLTKEKEFVLVGVGHLLGEEGVINQLIDLGYDVKKLK